MKEFALKKACDMIVDTELKLREQKQISAELKSDVEALTKAIASARCQLKKSQNKLRTLAVRHAHAAMVADMYYAAVVED